MHNTSVTSLPVDAFANTKSISTLCVSSIVLPYFFIPTRCCHHRNMFQSPISSIEVGLFANLSSMMILYVTCDVM